MTDLVRKITARIVGIGKQEIGSSFVVLGKCTRVSTGQTDLGPYVKLHGSFEAHNEQDGSIYRSSVLITPGGLVVDDVKLNLDHGVVEFAVRFRLVEAENSMGCEWTAEMLTESAQNDPLAALRSEVAKHLPPS